MTGNCYTLPVVGRPLRIEYAGALYHVTSKGNERKHLFLDTADRLRFLSLLSEYHDRYGVLVHSYVLMDDHYQLILETPLGNLLKVMHGINANYTGYFNRRHKHHGHLLEGRYRAIVVDKETHLVELTRYVHLSPVRAGVVRGPEQYRWSSYAAYVDNERKRDWVEHSWVLSKFSSKSSEARRSYREYVEQGLRGRIDDPFETVHGALVLGEHHFIEKIQRLLRGKSISPEITARRRLMANPRPDEIIRAVADAFGVTEETIKHKGIKDVDARKVAIYFVQRYSGLGNAAVGKTFGGIHYSAVSKASARLREAMRSDRKLARLVEALDSRFRA